MPTLLLEGALAPIWFNLPKAPSVADVLEYLQAHLSKEHFPPSPNPYLPDPEITLIGNSYVAKYPKLSLPVYLIKGEHLRLLGFASTPESALPFYIKSLHNLKITTQDIALVETTQASLFENYFTWPHFQVVIEN